MKHRLAIDIPQITDPCVLRVDDLSDYVKEMPVTCQRLDIVVPGYTSPVTIELNDLGFSANLTACDLGIQAMACDEVREELPDGVYTITYSVNPNDQVKVSYYHYRMASLLRKYHSLLCCLDLTKAHTPELAESLYRDLTAARIYMDGAVSKAEWCESPSEAEALYNEASELVDKLKCRYCVNC